MKIVVLGLQKFVRAVKSCAIISLAIVIFCIAVRISVFIPRSEYIPASSEPKTPIFVIDAGHGGEDPGAIGVNGVYEKDLNLSIANEIGVYLSEKGYRVVYTRTDDKMLYSEDENIKGFRKLSDLKNRLKIAKSNTDAILISIHMNSYAESKYSGLQGYYKPSCDKSRLLSESIQKSVRTEIQTENTRSVKKGNKIYILENYDGVGVLIECGFLSNPEECEKLCEKEYQKELSFSIVCGIIDYITKSF